MKRHGRIYLDGKSTWISRYVLLLEERPPVESSLACTLGDTIIQKTSRNINEEKENRVEDIHILPLAKELFRPRLWPEPASYWCWSMVCMPMPRRDMCCSAKALLYEMKTMH